MGIPRFAYFISNRYPLIIKKIKGDLDVPEIDNLYLDINGVIHNVCHRHNCDASQISETTKLIYLDACEVIKKIVHIIRPKQLLMISVDGVAPRAKMNQQRIRRFRKELDNAKLLEVEEEKINTEENKAKIFDSNAISAGTKFMFNLTLYMKDYILNEKKLNSEWSNIEIILSGSDVPGEGEHKILEYIRNYKVSEKYNPDTKHCIYGADADLIMLSLVSHEPNIAILREDAFKIRKREKLEKKGIEIINKDNNENETPYELILISILREYLELEFGYLKKKIQFNYDFEKIIDDFIFICFFIGNDFLPNLFSFNIENGALGHLYEFYKACLPELDGYLTDKGKINIFRMKTFLDFVSKHELHSIDMMIRKNKNENKNTKNRLQKANESKEQIKTMMKLKKEEKKKKLIEEIKSKSKEEQIIFKKNKKKVKIQNIQKKFQEISTELNQKYSFNEEYTKYMNKTCTETNQFPPKIEEILSEAKKYDNYIKNENYCSDFNEEDINDSDVSAIDIKEIMNEIVKNNAEEESKNENNIEEDDEDINKEFIEKLSKLKNSKEVKEFYYKEKLNIDIKTNEGKNERKKMFYFYLEGLQWILCYYYRGLKSWKWYYPYHYPPMISDYKDVIIDNSIYGAFNKFDKDTSQPFQPYQSLLLILPKQSFNLLPKCYQNIPNEIPDYFPDKINIDYNGKTASYESLLLLPFIDEKIILNLENKYRNLSSEEEKENNWGTSFIFYKNELENIAKYEKYEIYQIKNKEITKYNVKRSYFSFPSLKTIDYDYVLNNVKQYFGKSSNITKQITIYPKVKERIYDNKIEKYLHKKEIFIDYPFKALAKIKGFTYAKYYYYLYKDKLYYDPRFKLSNEVIESIRYFYQKRGIELEHPEILCDVIKFIGYEEVKGKKRKKYDDFNPFYVPFEITSLNSTCNDFEKYRAHLNSDLQENVKIK